MNSSAHSKIRMLQVHSITYMSDISDSGLPSGHYFSNSSSNTDMLVNKLTAIRLQLKQEFRDE